METPLILLRHSRTESLHPVNSGGADSAHQTGSEHGVAGSQCQNQLKVQIKSQDYGPPYCLNILAVCPPPQPRHCALASLVLWQPMHTPMFTCHT